MSANAPLDPCHLCGHALDQHPDGEPCIGVRAVDLVRCRRCAAEAISDYERGKRG